MALTVWNGDAVAVARIKSGSIDTVDVTPVIDTFVVTIGGLRVTQDADTDVATTAGLLVVALNLSTDVRFSAITWTNPSAGIITATADTPGVPFVAVLTVENGIGTVTDFGDNETGDTDGGGPNDASTAANWDTGSVPGAGDDTVLENSAVSILYGLDLSGGTMTSFTRRPTYTGTIGLPRNNPGGYVEYLDTYLKVDATLATIDASGSGRTKIDFGSVQNACTLNGSGTRAETGVPVVLLLGTHVSNALIVNKCDFGYAWFTGQDSKLATADLGFVDNQSSDVLGVFGAGMSQLTTVTINGGKTTILANATTVSYTTGVAELAGTATVTTLNVLANTFLYKSSGTCGTLNVHAGAIADFSRDTRNRTVSAANVNLAEGGNVNDPAYTVTWSAGIQPSAL